MAVMVASASAAKNISRKAALTEGMGVTAVTFEIEGDHIALRPARSVRQAQDSGFGMIQSRRKGVPADFDVASLVTEAP